MKNKQRLPLQYMSCSSAEHSVFALKRIVSSAFSLLVAYSLLGIIGGSLQLWQEGGLRLVSGKSWCCAFVLSLLIWTAVHAVPWLFRLLRRQVPIGLSRLYPLELQPGAFLLGFIVLSASDFYSRRFGFFPSSSLRILALYLGLILSLFAVLLGKSARGKSTISLFFSPWTLVFFQAALAAVFIEYTDGRFPYSDDHPSFVYRLHLLTQHFPHIPFYNTDWNAGYIAREFFATGSLNVFFAGLPFMHWFADLTDFNRTAVYSCLIAFLFIGVVPWCVYAGSRIFRLSIEQSVAAAMFALGPSTGYFEWLLRYGTAAFVFSAGLVVLVLALAYRLALAEEPVKWRQVLALLAASSLCILWSLAVLAFIPLVFLSLCQWRSTFARARLPKIAAFLLLFLILNGPWMITFVQEAHVLTYVSAGSMHAAKKGVIKETAGGSAAAPAAEAQKLPSVPVLASAEQSPSFLDQIKKKTSTGKKKFRELLLKMNPLLLMFFLPGLFALPRGKIRTALGSTIFWLLFLAALGDQFKPQLELKRMVIPAGFLMSVLAGPALLALLKRWETTQSAAADFFFRERLAPAIGQIVLFGAIFISPLAAGTVYLNRSWEKYVLSSPIVKDLSQAIKQHGGEGRTFFAGFVLHELGATWWGSQDGGHISLLAASTGKPLYASDFYHRYWQESDPIPLQYLVRDTEGIEEFLDLINATAVVTLTKPWAEYCSSLPRYKEVFHEDRWRMFVREVGHPSFVYRGRARVAEEKNGLRIWPESEEVVVKYRYFPKLAADIADGVELFPVPVFNQEASPGAVTEVSFIGLKVKPELIAEGRSVLISYHAW